MSKKTKKAQEESPEAPLEGAEQGQNQNNAADQSNGDAEDTNTETSSKESIQEALALEKDRYLRLFAEFENYKRRTSKERIELFKETNKKICEKEKIII